MNKLKIAINTLAPYNNCGGILQAFALQTTLDELGHDAYVVARDRTLEGRPVLPFAFNYLKWDKRKIIDIKQDEYDCIVTGSDQIFRREWVDAGYLYGATSFALDWPIKKIGYAISMGVPTWNYTDSETALIKKSFNTYSGISFRENDCTYMVKSRGVDNAITVPDPTLLLKREQYEELIKDIPVRENKCFVYLLGALGNRGDILQTDGGQQLLRLLKIKYGTDNITIDKNSVEEWVAAFRDAKFIITDSYHGCIFSLIFNKPFICIMNETRGTSRFNTLIEEYNLHQRFYTSFSNINWDILSEPLNSEEHIKSMYNKGREFLISSLDDTKAVLNESIASPLRKENAYITMLSTDNYLKYVITLWDSLMKTNPKYNFYVATTPNILDNTKQILDKLGIKHIEIDPSDLKDFSEHKRKYMEKWEKALPKFALWKLTQFDKCIFLDSDMVITDNIDNLFDYPEWSAVEDAAPVRFHGKYQVGESVFCSGVLVFKPSLETYNDLIKGIYNLPEGIAWHDQAMMAYFHQNWIDRKELHIPFEYDYLYLLSTSTAVAKGQIDLSKIKVHHYCLKNWTQEQIQPIVRPYYAKYKKLVEETYIKYLKSLSSGKLKKCIGIISYLTDDLSERQLRTTRISEAIRRISEVWPYIDILVIAQNWKDFKLPVISNNVIVHKYDKLGIVGARKQLRKDFLALDYDYIIMMDDDEYLHCDDYSRDEYIKRIDENPNKFCFLKGPGLSGIYRSGALKCCAISKYVYGLEDLSDIDPQKGEGYEDIIYAILLHAKYPELEFDAPTNIYSKYRYVVSTWSANQTVSGRKQMRYNTKLIIDHIMKYKEYPLVIKPTEDVNKQVIYKDKIVEKVIEKVVEKEVEKPIYKYVEKIVDRPVEVRNLEHEEELANKNKILSELASQLRTSNISLRQENTDLKAKIADLHKKLRELTLAANTKNKLKFHKKIKL